MGGRTALDGRTALEDRTALSGRTALVLGGGGVTGLAWEAGVLAGMADRGVDVAAGADVVVGTSAGAVAGAKIAVGTTADDLYAEQLAEPAVSISATFGMGTGVRLLGYQLLPGRLRRRRARLGRAARRVGRRADGGEVRRIIDSLDLPQAWPSRELLLTAVDTETGGLRVFNRDASAPLPLAVAASCAVPLVWPPIRIGGRSYMDGGIRSPTNTDLVVRAESVVVIAPLPQALTRAGRLSVQMRRLGPGVRSVVVTPDRHARSAFGRDFLDQSRAVPSARAGFEQGVQAAAEMMSNGGVSHR